MLLQIHSAAEVALLHEPGQLSLLRLGPTTHGKWGLDEADAKYQTAPIDPARSDRGAARRQAARRWAP